MGLFKKRTNYLVATSHKMTLGLLAFVLTGTIAESATAQITNPDVLLNGFGGDAGYGELSQGRNDDGSSAELDLPFSINFFGNQFNSFWINNNGNLTFQNPLSSFTPQPFPQANQPLIAPWWADVDTSCLECGEVYVGSPNAETVVATWDQVGFFPADPSLTNTFQVVLRDRSADFSEGDFDIEFRYGGLNWTTGDASGGSGGLGGTPAQAGFDAGDLTNFLSLPGSFTEEVLELVNTSNVGVDGLWSYAIRSGELPGESPDNPLLPVPTDDGFNFDFNVGDINDTIFIDPEVAVGYNYIVNSGPNIRTVQVATDAGDGLYDIFFPDGMDGFFDSGFDIGINEPFDFTANGFDDGVSSFSIRGIEIEANLDPTDPLAFVTGLQFVDTGAVNLDQNPIVVNTDVPESTSILSLLALGSLGLLTRFQKKQ